MSVQKYFPTDPGITQPAHRAVTRGSAAGRATTMQIAVTAVTLCALLVSANLATPLFPLLEARLGITSFGTTVAFSSYVISLIVGLILFRAFVNRANKRITLLCATVVAAFACFALAAAPTLVLFCLARILQGAAIACATVVASAILRDLHPDQPVFVGKLTLLSTSGGVALGPVIGGFVSLGDHPTVTPFLALAVVLGLLVLLCIAVFSFSPSPRVASEPALADPVRLRSSAATILSRAPVLVGATVSASTGTRALVPVGATASVPVPVPMPAAAQSSGLVTGTKAAVLNVSVSVSVPVEAIMPAPVPMLRRPPPVPELGSAQVPSAVESASAPAPGTDPAPGFEAQSRRPPASIRRAFWIAAFTGFVSFTLFGLCLSLAPGYFASIVGTDSRFVIGLLCAVVLAASALSQLLSVEHPKRLSVGLWLLAGAVATLPLAGLFGSGILLVVVCALAGIGQGVAFQAAFTGAISVVSPAAHGRTVSGVYTVTYLGSALPVIALGALSDSIGLSAAIVVFTLLLAVGAAVLGVIAFRVPKVESIP